MLSLDSTLLEKQKGDTKAMTETASTGHTIHIHRHQWHLAWDHSIPPIAIVRSGETVSFDLLEASCGQIGPDSTVEAVRTLDFSRVDQVNGPIYVEGAVPGDTLEIEFLDLRPDTWGGRLLSQALACSRTNFLNLPSKSGSLREGPMAGQSLFPVFA